MWNFLKMKAVSTFCLVIYVHFWKEKKTRLQRWIWILNTTWQKVDCKQWQRIWSYISSSSLLYGRKAVDIIWTGKRIISVNLSFREVDVELNDTGKNELQTIFNFLTDIWSVTFPNGSPKTKTKTVEFQNLHQKSKRNKDNFEDTMEEKHIFGTSICEWKS